ncbi:MAG: TetR/AcrR family transcriptional regulator [Sporichthyaceae bacterium]
MSLRERKKAALRDTLVRNAIELFRERGYDAVGLDEIVAASMCSRSTFHRYFGTKEDLLFPTAAEQLETLTATLRSAPPIADPWQFARAAVTEGVSGFLDNLEPDLRAECIALWFSQSAPRKRYLEIVLEWEQVLSAYLEPFLPPRPTRELELHLLASSITSALRATLDTAMSTGRDVRMLVNHAFDLIEEGVSANLLTLRAGSASR